MQQEKKRLRNVLLKQRHSINNKMLKDGQICQHITSWIDTHFSSSQNIAVYLAKAPEVNIDIAISALLDGPHTLYSPCYQNQTWQLSHLVSLQDTHIGHFGIREDRNNSVIITADQIDIWLIPGLAFDKSGNRLGYGKGIYDQWLAQSKGLKIGISYFDQIIPTIPTDKWDQNMDIIITEKGVLGQDS